MTELVLAALVRAPLSGRGGGPSPFGGALGASRHRRFQDQRLAEDPDYRAELALEAEFLHQGWTVQLRGRADGVQGLSDAGANPIVVEELKTGVGKLDPSQRRAEAYALQAASYAWMIARTTDRPVETRLIWWPLDEVSPSSIPVPWSLHEVETRLRARLAPVDLPFAVQLRAKRDLCATGIVWCDESACTLAADPGPRGDRVLAELLGKTVLDGADLLDLGTREAVCPYALAHTAGARLPFSIADVHHLVHPYPLRGRAGEDVFEGAPCPPFPA